jgi:hypothetical protein
VGSPSALAKAETSHGRRRVLPLALDSRQIGDVHLDPADQFGERHVRPSRSRRMYFPKAIRSPMALRRGVNTSNDGLLGI